MVALYALLATAIGATIIAFDADDGYMLSPLTAIAPLAAVVYRRLRRGPKQWH